MESKTSDFMLGALEAPEYSTVRDVTDQEVPRNKELVPRLGKGAPLIPNFRFSSEVP